LHFTKPVDITSLVASITGVTVTRTTVPATGVDVDQVRRQVTKLAVPFFRRTLTCEECEDD
jgi:hypothetical protein